MNEIDDIAYLDLNFAISVDESPVVFKIVCCSWRHSFPYKILTLLSANENYKWLVFLPVEAYDTENFPSMFCFCATRRSMLLFWHSDHVFIASQWERSHGNFAHLFSKLTNQKNDLGKQQVTRFKMMQSKRKNAEKNSYHHA